MNWAVASAQLSTAVWASRRAEVVRLSADHGYGGDVRFEPYRMGSAFLKGER